MKLKLRVVSTPVKSKVLLVRKPAPPTGPDPIAPAQYVDSCGAPYNEAGARSRGWTVIEVLSFLWGRKLDEVVMAYVHALRPSYVRITNGGMTLDARTWRVTIVVDDKNFVKRITQEVSVTLPTGVAHGEALGQALQHGVSSPQVRWHQDVDGYMHIFGGYFKTTSKGKRVEWKFKNGRNRRLWKRVS